MIGSANSRLVHPFLIFGGIWTFDFLLYSLGLSGQLIFDAGDFYYLYFCIVGGFLAGYVYLGALIAGVTGRDPLSASDNSFRLNRLSNDDAAAIWRRVTSLLRVWAVITVVEIIVSGGIPIVWLFSGSDKNYADFGIHSLHGLTMSMLLSASTISAYLFIETRRPKFAALPVAASLWFIACITRGFLIGIILQILFLYLSVRQVRPAQMAKIAVGFIILVVFFGIIGDLRSGGGTDLVRAVARPTERFPDWLPSGFLWVYLYLVTPLNNLFNTVQVAPSIDGFSVAVTTSQLFPTVIRDAILDPGSMRQVELVDTNLNISTGFVGPYLDMGITGIVLFSLFTGAVASIFWSLRRSRFFLLGYAFVAHSLLLSVFYDEILFLPFLFQLVWFWYFLRPLSVAARHAVAHRTGLT